VITYDQGLCSGNLVLHLLSAASNIRLDREGRRYLFKVARNTVRYEHERFAMLVKDHNAHSRRMCPVITCRIELIERASRHYRDVMAEL
jgi:hypothetical protein